MDWIKRNLYFVIGAVVALALLGGAGWYLYSKLTLNDQKSEALNKAYEDLKNFNKQPVHPGNGPVDNIKAAKEQTVELRSFQDKVRTTFGKIPPIPHLPKITDRDFSFALSRTISTLRLDATNFGVALPPDYDFSFLAQSKKASFPPGTVEPLSVQLGEVKALCDILFQAKINALDFLRRERVSPDDATGSATDYLGDKAVTNDMAILTPYEIVFRCFSPELASVLGNFASSPRGFVAKTVNVEQEGAMMGVETTGPTPNIPVNPVIPSRYAEEGRYSRPAFGPGATAPAPAVTGPRGVLPTVLDEKKLRVTMAITVVKLLPPKEQPGGPRRPGPRGTTFSLPEGAPYSTLAGPSQTQAGKGR